MGDKDATGILRALLPVTSTIVTTAASTPRAHAGEELAVRVRALDPMREVIVEPAPGAALDRALEHAATVCVAGSIFLAGAVRDLLRRACYPAVIRVISAISRVCTRTGSGDSPARLRSAQTSPQAPPAAPASPDDSSTG